MNESIIECADKSLSYIEEKKYTMAEKMLLVKKEITAHLLFENRQKQLGEFYYLFMIISITYFCYST